MKSLQTARNRTISKEARDAAKALVRPDLWAIQLALEADAKHFTTNRRSYIIPVMRDGSDEIIIKKAAQMGFTVGMIVKALHHVTQRRWHGMYLLPFKQGTRTFVQGRVDPIIDSSLALKGRFRSVENVAHKQTDQKVNLYFRGTNIATELREVPVDFEIWDERDKFVTTWLGDARARMDGSDIGKLVQLSTPTGPGLGVDADDNWRISDQCLWEVPCPHCNRYQVLRLDENVKLGDTVYDSVLECSHCHKKITNKQRWAANEGGRWVPQYLDGRKRGYHISQFNSPTKRLRGILEDYFEGQTDTERLRDFYNLTLGEPYAGLGDKFTESILDDCRTNGVRLGMIPQGPLYVGVDVGAALHCKTSFINGQNRIAWAINIFKDFDDLADFLDSLHNFNCVIDAHPEKNKAKELAKEYKGRVWLGLEKDKPNQTEIAVFDDKKMEVSIDRTMAFDQYIGDHSRGVYVYSPDAREWGEYMPRKNYNGFYAHHMEMVRVPRELPGGIKTFRWEKTRNPDHWHHAGMFEAIAMRRKPRLHVTPTVRNAFREAGGLINA